MKFDQDGKYLGVGDKAGRIIIFKAADSKKKEDKFGYYYEVSICLSSLLLIPENLIHLTVATLMKRLQVCHG